MAHNRNNVKVTLRAWLTLFNSAVSIIKAVNSINSSFVFYELIQLSNDFPCSHHKQILELRQQMDAVQQQYLDDCQNLTTRLLNAIHSRQVDIV